LGLLVVCHFESPGRSTGVFTGELDLGNILDWNPDGSGPILIPISHHPDEVVSVTRGYGKAQKPDDFLDSFAAFVRIKGNVNKIAALKVVLQRPRDLTRAELKSLRHALDGQGYSEANLGTGLA